VQALYFIQQNSRSALSVAAAEPKGLLQLSMYKIYILLCSDNSFYTGYTDNLRRRLNEHNSRTHGSVYLKGRLPVKLVYYENVRTKLDAIKREKQIKGWVRQKKINLIKHGHPTMIDANCLNH
jgi:putative endonuclease